MDKRRFSRHPVNFNVDVTFSNQQCATFRASDLSQGGMYISSENTCQPSIGELLRVKLVEGPHIQESIPCQNAVVVHKGRYGFGLSFVEMKDGVLA